MIHTSMLAKKTFKCYLFDLMSHYFLPNNCYCELTLLKKMIVKFLFWLSSVFFSSWEKISPSFIVLLQPKSCIVRFLSNQGTEKPTHFARSTPSGQLNTLNVMPTTQNLKALVL